MASDSRPRWCATPLCAGVFHRAQPAQALDALREQPKHGTCSLFSSLQVSYFVSWLTECLLSQEPASDACPLAQRCCARVRWPLAELHGIARAGSRVSLPGVPCDCALFFPPRVDTRAMFASDRTRTLSSFCMSNSLLRVQIHLRGKIGLARCKSLASTGLRRPR